MPALVARDPLLDLADDLIGMRRGDPVGGLDVARLDRGDDLLMLTDVLPRTLVVEG